MTRLLRVGLIWLLLSACDNANDANPSIQDASRPRPANDSGRLDTGLMSTSSPAADGGDGGVDSTFDGGWRPSGGDSGGADVANLPQQDAAIVPGTATRAIVNPPTYSGSGSGVSGCPTTYRTVGFEPNDARTGLPLFLYFVGSRGSANDASAQYDSLAPLAVTEAMARRGFLALSVEYDNAISLDIVNKALCLFGGENANNLLKVACALPRVDCSNGIATWGHSQGAALAHAASIFETRIRAVWTTGYGGNGFPLPVQRLRVVNALGDTMNSSIGKLNEATGQSSNDCPDDGRRECLRPDGSGWIRVLPDDCAYSAADHCWFDRRDCFSNTLMLEPNWVDPSSQAPFALEPNADWVAATARRP